MEVKAAMKMSRFGTTWLLVLVPLTPQLVSGQDPSVTQLQQWVVGHNVAAIRALGRPVLPKLVQLYEAASDVGFKARVAQTLYELGWESPAAKRALMKDAHTLNQDLRLQVQWALGRVSNDQDVVDTLLANMRSDPNPLFRDKAACALAHDQIHLTEDQRVYLFGRLIQALRDPEPQVRDIASKALQIQTGQNKGYRPDASPEEREAAIHTWERWLQEYRDNM